MRLNLGNTIMFHDAVVHAYSSSSHLMLSDMLPAMSASKCMNTTPSSNDRKSYFAESAGLADMALYEHYALYIMLLHKWHSLLFPLFTAASLCLLAFFPLHQVAHSSPVKLFIMRTVPRSHTLPDWFWVLYLSIPHKISARSASTTKRAT